MAVHLNLKILRPAAGTPGIASVETELVSTVKALKTQIANVAALPEEGLRLVCEGRIWEDSATVASYGVGDGAVVHCLDGPSRAAPAPEEPVPEPSPTKAAKATKATKATKTTKAATKSLEGSDDFQRGQQLMRDPVTRQEILGNPEVQQLFNSPDTIMALVRMHPELAKLVATRPDIAKLLEDPAKLQQSMRQMQNPSLMREMARQQDRAIGHLDAMPGGRAMLQQAHAAAAANPTSQVAVAAVPPPNMPAGVSQVVPGAGANREALPNPWSAPAPVPAPVPGRAAAALAA